MLRQEGANRKMASLRYHKFWIGFWDYRYIERYLIKIGLVKIADT
jgi:hypothetical protein